MLSDEANGGSSRAGHGHSPDPDDLRAVQGIGPKAEGCLKKAGIKDLGQLARTPVNELAAALAGLRGKFDADRIARERWVAQAAALAAMAASPGPNGEAELTRPVRHSFTVEVRLPLADRDVVSTKIVHVQTGDEETWAGWDPPRMVAFIEDRSGMRADVRPAEEAPAEDAWADLPERPGAGATAPREARLHTYAMVAASGEGAVGGRINAGTATLTFDPATLGLSAQQTATAQVEVFARQLLTGSSVAVGSRSAMVHPEQQVRVEVPCDLSRPSRPFVLFALVRVLVRDGEARPPARELAGGRLSVAPAGRHRPMAAPGTASFKVTA